MTAESSTRHFVMRQQSLVYPPMGDNKPNEQVNCPLTHLHSLESVSFDVK